MEVLYEQLLSCNYLGFATEEIFPLLCLQEGHRTRLHVLFATPGKETRTVVPVCRVPSAAPLLLGIPRPQTDAHPYVSSAKAHLQESTVETRAPSPYRSAHVT